MVKDATDRQRALVQQLQDQLALGRTLQEAKLRLLPLFSENELDTAVDHLKAIDNRFRSAKEVATLHDEPNYSGWYGGPSDKATSVWTGLQQQLKRKAWSEATIENLDLASTGVVEQIAPPRSEKSIRVKGLVVGYVQSGKTANYSAAIAKAVDAGYKLVVVLAGMHNNLRKQTQERLKSELVDPNPSLCTTLTSVDEEGDFQKRQNVAASRALSVEGFTLVVLKKNSAVLRNFYDWLGTANDEVIKRTPTLVVDDESDQASINTSKPEDDPTAINSHIRRLMDRFHVCTYVGYTATPFANVLVDATIDSDVFPRDFLISLGKAPNYFGAEELFGRDKVGALDQKDGLRLIRLISPEDEAALAPGTLKELQKSGEPITLLTESIKSAIDAFILGCAARTARGQHKKHMTMLLHVSHLTGIQGQLKIEVDAYLTSQKFAAESEDHALTERLQALWVDDFESISRDFPGVETISFDKVWKYARRVISEIDSILENSKSLDRLSYAGDSPLRSIVIGGNTLSRGLTLEGLTVSYFIRTAKAYDTLLQMGRWFGYRPGYVDLTRIYVTEDLRDYFFHLATIEQEMRDEIKVMAANGERPIDVGLRIRNHPHLTVTAANKMRRAQDCALTYAGTKIQARHVITDDRDVAEANLAAVQSLLQRSSKFGKRTNSLLQDFRNALLFREVPPEVILQFLDEYFFSPENGRFTNELLTEYISQQHKVDELKDWSVAFLSSESGAELKLADVTLRVFDRSILKRSFQSSPTNSVQLRALATPGDELVDLGDLLDPQITRTEMLLPEGREGESEIALRRRFRPAQRGLLLIHPLNWMQATSDAKKYSLSEPLRAQGPVFGVTFVFPFTGKDQSRFGFIANRTITGPRSIPTGSGAPAPQPAPVELPRPLIAEQKIGTWRLSKSQYVKGRKCLKRVWLYNHHRELADDPTELQRLLFKQGHQVGTVAQKYFQSGHLIDEDFLHPEEALAHTDRAIKDKSISILFEAAFLYDNVLIRADVIRKNLDGSIDLIEVKSTTSVKKEHKDDVAIQKYVLERLGHRVNATYLMHLNGAYVLDGDLRIQDLFILEVMDEEIEEHSGEVPNYIKLIRDKLSEESEPASQIGSVCKNPYPCEFKSHCWKGVTEDSIHSLVRISDRKRSELLAMGIALLKDIPDDFELSDPQRIQVQVAKRKQSHFEKSLVRKYLATLQWPLHFLDFETIPYPIPKYNQSSPYQQVPFQYSLHVQRERNGPLEHYEFLHRDPSDPRAAFAESLLGHIDGDKGTIVVYHAGFERNITDALKQVLPDLEGAFLEVTTRMWDLEVPFAKRWICQPGFAGSSSIKYVLPVLVPSLSYKGLAIQKGDVAQKRYGEMIEMGRNPEAEKIARALLEYCKLDTLAMVEILKHIVKAVHE